MFLKKIDFNLPKEIGADYVSNKFILSYREEKKLITAKYWLNGFPNNPGLDFITIL